MIQDLYYIIENITQKNPLKAQVIKNFDFCRSLTSEVIHLLTVLIVFPTIFFFFWKNQNALSLSTCWNLYAVPHTLQNHCRRKLNSSSFFPSKSKSREKTKYDLLWDHIWWCSAAYVVFHAQLFSEAGVESHIHHNSQIPSLVTVLQFLYSI